MKILNKRNLFAALVGAVLLASGCAQNNKMEKKTMDALKGKEGVSTRK